MCILSLSGLHLYEEVTPYEPIKLFLVMQYDRLLCVPPNVFSSSRFPGSCHVQITATLAHSKHILPPGKVSRIDYRPYYFVLLYKQWNIFSCIKSSPSLRTGINKSLQTFAQLNSQLRCCIPSCCSLETTKFCSSWLVLLQVRSTIHISVYICISVCVCLFVCISVSVNEYQFRYQ